MQKYKSPNFHYLNQSVCLISLTIKGCVRLSVMSIMSCHFIISHLNAPSQCSDNELNI